MHKQRSRGAARLVECICWILCIILLFKPGSVQAAGVLTETSTAKAIVTLKQVNHWYDGKRYYEQYELTLTNGSVKTLNGWSMKIAAAAYPKRSSCWNTTMTLSGKVMTFSAMNYNKVLAKKAQASGIGFIISFATKQKSLAGTYQYSKTLKRFVRTSTSTKIPVSSGTAQSAPTSSNSASSGTKQPSSSSNVADSTDTSRDIPSTPPKASAGSAYSKHGRLTVKGANLVDKNGSIFQLKGVSTHGIAWYPEYVNKAAFKTLRDNWGINTIRLAMYTAEYGGYLNGGDQKKLEATLDTGIRAATSLGMYVILDWHILSDGNPNTHKKEAGTFFSRMSGKYKSYGNILYEICNEPNGGVTWSQIRSYANYVIPMIRKNSSKAVILVGTPTWSQDIDQVVGHQVTQKTNVMYTLHFYAATHKDQLRSKLVNARKKGLPIFISEFSICDASGAGQIDYASARTWKKLINQYKLSFCGWSLSNKSETSALIKSSCRKTSGWTWNELSDTGKWLMTLACGK